MTDTGEVDDAQPAIPSSPSTGQPPDVYEYLDRGYKRLVHLVQTIRAHIVFRTSSALVRWILLVLAIGIGAALLVALTIETLVSFLPGGGG
jgi:hypothetical protein